jgi:hypothetical protein
VDWWRDLNYKDIEVPFWALRNEETKPKERLPSKYTKISRDFIDQ